jgi:hypothetical protein
MLCLLSYTGGCSWESHSMTITATATRRTTSRILRSPLAVPDGSVTPAAEADTPTPVPEAVVLSDRGATLAEFEDYLRTVTTVTADRASRAKSWFCIALKFRRTSSQGMSALRI